MRGFKLNLSFTTTERVGENQEQQRAEETTATATKTTFSLLNNKLNSLNQCFFFLALFVQ